MTKYNFQYIKVGQSAFYKLSESEEKGFRNAVTSWSKQKRQGGHAVLFHCKKVTERDVEGKKVFLGIRITREF